jgi:outer membrane protein assembly factor BamB
MQPAPHSGRRLALLVATSAYSDPDLRQLRSPGHDAGQLAAVLRDPQIGGFDVQVLIDPASGEVQEGIEDFCTDRHPDDQLLIYLSCHGVLDSYGRLYYAAANTRRQRLAATAVAAAWLNERLEDCRARRQILVLDCCHSGAFAKGTKGDADLALQHRFEPHGRGRVVLTASRSTEYSFEGGQASGEGVPSVFTHAVVNGLRTGDADRDKDGLITVTDLYQYVYDNVRAVESRQTPELWTYGAEGNLLVARSVRGAVVKPEPLPEDLRLILESPRRRVRETGVGELADLLDGPGPGLALSARQALERIAEEDHPQVAALARIAIDAPAGTAAGQVRRELTDRAHREELERQEAARRETEEKTRRETEPTPEPLRAKADALTSGQPQTTILALTTETSDTVENQQLSDPTSGRLTFPWRFAMGGRSPGLAYDGFRIAVVGNGDQVVALDPANGGVLWRTSEFPVLTAAPPVIDEDTMLIAGGDQHLWALDVNTGAIRRRVSLNATPTAAPIVIGSLAVIPTADGCLTGIDYHSGDQAWRKKFSQPIFGPVTTDGRALYVAGHDCHIRAWRTDPEKQSISNYESWSFRARKWFDNAPAIYGNSLFVGGYDGRLHHLDRRKGKNRRYWYYQAGGMIKGKLAVSDDVVAFGCYDGFVYAIDMRTRQERWPAYQAGSAIKAGVLILGSIVYAASRDGVLHMIDLRNGQGIGTYATGGAINVTPVAVGRFVIVGSDNGAVSAVDGKTLTGPAH